MNPLSHSSCYTIGVTRTTTSTTLQQPHPNREAVEPFQAPSSSGPSLVRLLSSHHATTSQLLHESSLSIMGPMSGPRAVINSIDDPMDRQFAILEEALRIVNGERDGETAEGQWLPQQ